MKFTICNEIFGGWSLPDTFAYARRAGYEAVEIAPFTVAPYVTDVPATRRREIRDEAARAGVALSGIHWVLAQTEGLHLTTSDDAVRARTGRYFVELVDFCHDLGGRYIILGSPKQRALEPGVTTEQGVGRMLAALRDAVKRAEDTGITICFEPLAPSETNFINRAADAVAIARRVGSPAFSVLLDVKAMSAEDRPVPQVIRETAGNFAYFHANDPNLKGPGFGEVDFRPIAAALRDVGYAGHVSVEVFNFEEGPEYIATQSRANLRAAFGE